MRNSGSSNPTVSFRMPRGQVEWLDKLAKNKKCNRQDLVLDACRRVYGTDGALVGAPHSWNPFKR